MFRRMVRAALFNAGVYRELRDDPTATLQAFGVISLGSAALILALILGQVQDQGIGAYALVFTSVFSAGIVGWVIVSLLSHLVGARLLRKDVTLPSMLRTIGFSNAPAVGYIFLAVSTQADLLQLINAGILMWILLAMSVALRQTLSIPFAGALWMAIPGILIMVVIRGIFAGTLLSGLYVG